MKYRYDLIRYVLWIAWVLEGLWIAGGVAHASPQFSVEEEAKNLTVMITAQLGGEDRRIGAGIIFGVDSDSLYIATVNHVIRQGKQEAQNLRVQLRSLPDKPVMAKLLSDFDSTLDLAVLRMTGVKGLGIDVKALPFDRVGNLNSLNRGDEVYSIGYRQGHPWAMNVTPDRLADKTKDRLYFESNFIGPGQSGGALLDKGLDLVGMIRNDYQPPEGEAVDIVTILEQLRQWNYPVNLGRPLEPMSFAELTVGNRYACGITIRGVAYCFGKNNQGQLGNGTTISRTTMKRVIGRLTFKSLSSSTGSTLLNFQYVGDHTCGVIISGAAYCWRANSAGQIGDGSTYSYTPIPVLVKGGLIVTAQVPG